jgi:hypothetical protein
VSNDVPVSNDVREFLGQQQTVALMRMLEHRSALEEKLRSAGRACVATHPYAALATGAALGFLAMPAISQGAPAGLARSALKGFKLWALSRVLS